MDASGVSRLRKSETVKKPSRIESVWGMQAAILAARMQYHGCALDGAAHLWYAGSRTCDGGRGFTDDTHLGNDAAFPGLLLPDGSSLLLVIGEITSLTYSS